MQGERDGAQTRINGIHREGAPMKRYVLMTSLALMAGAGIGYWNGKGAAHTQFVTACTDTKFTVVYDYGSDEHRHFHCFELDTEKPEPPPPTSASLGGQWDL
jgi:hypothetical protein